MIEKSRLDISALDIKKCKDGIAEFRSELEKANSYIATQIKYNSIDKKDIKIYDLESIATGYGCYFYFGLLDFTKLKISPMMAKYCCEKIHEVINKMHDKYPSTGPIIIFSANRSDPNKVRFIVNIVISKDYSKGREVGDISNVK